MRLGGRAIAMQLAVERGERFWSFKVGYDEAFTHFSPSILLRLHMLARSVSLGLRSFELLGVLDPSKQMWNPVKRPCVTLRAYPYGPRGLVLLGSDAARLALSRLRKLRIAAVPYPFFPVPYPFPDGRCPRERFDVAGYRRAAGRRLG